MSKETRYRNVMHHHQYPLDVPCIMYSAKQQHVGCVKQNNFLDEVWIPGRSNFFSLLASSSTTDLGLSKPPIRWVPVEGRLSLGRKAAGV
jgi:hypothetical protein